MSNTGPGPAVAAIDCGTNSTRLLVMDGSGAPLTRRMQITRLGQGVAATGRLTPEAIERTVSCLNGYRRVMDDLAVDRVRMTATSAARDAENRDELFAAAAAVIGVAPELLDGEEEGRLSFVGATAELAADSGPFLVADVGGGSTELVAGPAPGGDRFRIAGVRSLAAGCVRITETYLTSDPPTAAELRDAEQAVDDLLSQAWEEVPAFAEPATFVGLAGTVSALCRLDQGLEIYDRDRVHHAVLTRDAVNRLLARLAAESTAQRREEAGMEEDRADVIVGGAVILARLLHHADTARCLVSESDILDGLAMTLLEAS